MDFSTLLRVWEGPVAEKRVKRGLAAILAADVVGYSRMMREDEARTLAKLKAIQRFPKKLKAVLGYDAMLA